MDDEVATPKETFPGFLLTQDIIKKNWKKVAHLSIPHDYFDEICSQIDNIAELKIVMYIYRHTFGFQEPKKAKHLTVDDFMYGRDSENGRMDRGTGLSEMSVRNGIKKALEHGYIVVDTNDKSKKNIKKSYRLNTRELEVQSLDPSDENNEPEVQSLDPEVQNVGENPQDLDPSTTNFVPPNIERNQKDTFIETEERKDISSLPLPNKYSRAIGQIAFRRSGDLQQGMSVVKEILLWAREQGMSEADFSYHFDQAEQEVKKVNDRELQEQGYADHLHYFCVLLDDKVAADLKQQNNQPAEQA